MPEEGGGWIRFGIFEVNSEERVLLRKGIRVRLQDKPLSVLLLLLQNSGKLVGREELRRKLWPAGTNVDFEHGMSVAMHKLRAALDDPAERPRYIETVPGHGYRWIAPVVHPKAEARVESRSLLVVLPFIGYGAASELDHIADGFTEELTAQISKTMPARLGVIGRTTAGGYRGSTKSIAEIGSEIGADYALEGSVRAQNGVLRLTAQLIRVSDQSHVWAESVDGDGANSIQSQVELSERITRALAAYLFPAESSVRTPRPKRRPNEEAYALYRQGRVHYPGGSEREGFLGAQCFHQAIAKDPDFVLPHALLSILYTSAALFDSGIVTDASQPTLAMLAKHFGVHAMELDPDCGEARFAMAALKFHFDWDWRAAEAHYKKGLELSPNFSLGYLIYALGLAHMGLFREARAQLDAAAQLEPVWPFLIQWKGWVLYFTGDYQQALAILEKEIAIRGDYIFTNLLLSDVYISGGRPADAIPLLRKLYLMSDGHTLANAALVCAYARFGQEAEARQWLKVLEDSSPTRSVSPYHHAMALASLGETDLAFAMLDKAVLNRSGWIPQLNIDPGFQVRHSDPRWMPLLERTSPMRVRRQSREAAHSQRESAGRCSFRSSSMRSGNWRLYHRKSFGAR